MFHYHHDNDDDAVTSARDPLFYSEQEVCQATQHSSFLQTTELDNSVTVDGFSGVGWLKYFCGDNCWVTKGKEKHTECI